MSSLHQKNISQILRNQNVIAPVGMSKIVRETLKNQENNIHFFCRDQKNSNKKFFFKYQIQKDTNQSLKSRRQFNLANEINFYQSVKNHQFEHLIIPRYFQSSIKPNPWLITEKITLANSYSFPNDVFFSAKKISPKYISIIIRGLKEFHQQKNSLKKFHKQSMSDLTLWFQFLTKNFTGPLKPIVAIIPKLLLKYKRLWNENCHYMVHGDLVVDTFAFSPNNKLILFDFEKVQISHPAFDYSSFVINPRNHYWNQQFFFQLKKIYPDRSFIILFYISWLLRLCHLLGNFNSGRLDNVFRPIIGSRNFLSTKSLYLKLWPQEIYRLLDQINNLS